MATNVEKTRRPAPSSLFFVASSSFAHAAPKQICQQHDPEISTLNTDPQPTLHVPQRKSQSAECPKPAGHNNATNAGVPCWPSSRMWCASFGGTLRGQPAGFDVTANATTVIEKHRSVGVASSGRVGRRSAHRTRVPTHGPLEANNHLPAGNLVLASYDTCGGYRCYIVNDRNSLCLVPKNTR